jgi:pimeloyl-ACP methyl ester carboxylesterase
MVPANGVDLCVETFGDRTDPPVLLIAGGASSMDWWEDEFCRRLAAGHRYVIRYDHRDTGRSTSFPVGAPPYSMADLAADALGLLDALEIPRAHVVGMSMGGGLAQRIAVQMQDAVDWSDRTVVVDRLVAEVRQLGGPFTADEPHLRRLIERVVDRTTDMAAAPANHWLAGAGTPIRDRLAAITAPTLILHGAQDPVYPVAAAEALAAEIPGARLVLLEGVGHEHPPAALWTLVLTELLRHTG